MPWRQLGWFGVGAVIHHIGTLVFYSRGEFRRQLPHFRRGARLGGVEAKKQQTGHDPDKNAELDRNKMCKFQIHFPMPLPAYQR